MGKEYERQIMVLGEVPSLGPVLLFDDMEGLLKWAQVGDLGDDVFEKSAAVAFNGSASLHIKTRTTNSAEDDETSGQRILFERPGLRYSIECIYQFLVQGDTKGVWFKVEMSDGALRHRIELKFVAISSKWQYRNSGNTFTDVPGGAQGLLEAGWHRIRFEFDQNKKEYIKMVSDGLEVDLTGISYYTGAEVADRWLDVQVGIIAAAVGPVEGYFDDVLLLEI